MDEFIMTAYELASVLVPFLVVYAVVRTCARRTGHTAARLLPGLVFAAYVFAVLYVTGAGTLFDLVRIVQGTPRLPSQISLVPFAAGIETGTMLNVAMFVPLGIMLPLIWRRKARLAPVAVFGFLFSLIIELSQLLNNRATDIDDLLANTLGALVGFGAFKLWELLSARAERASNQPSYPGNLYSGRHALLPGLSEPALYLATMLAGHFLLFDGWGASEALYRLLG